MDIFWNYIFKLSLAACVKVKNRRIQLILSQVGICRCLCYDFKLLCCITMLLIHKPVRKFPGS